jgi:membrane protein implicated in regulation of membrane protease activity
MDPLLLFIDDIQPWQFMVGAVVIFVISAVSGEFDILPWVAISTILMAFLDYFGFSPLVQMGGFSFSLVITSIFGRRYLNKSNFKGLIAENIHQMIDKSVRVTVVSHDDDTVGEAMSASGKVWNVRHIAGETLILNDSYECTEVEGISLLVK